MIAMASIVKRERKDKIYYYISDSYWDKEKGRPDSRRQLVGRLDKNSGELHLSKEKNRYVEECKKNPALARELELLQDLKRAVIEINFRRELALRELQELQTRWETLQWLMRSEGKPEERPSSEWIERVIAVANDEYDEFIESGLPVSTDNR